MKTVISTIALKFLEKGGSGFIKLDPAVSKPAPEWLPKQKEFNEARGKGLVSLSGDAENGTQNLDTELVKLATKLEVAFTAEMPQSKLEELVEAASDKKTSLIEDIKSAGGDANANMKFATLEAKLDELTK